MEKKLITVDKDLYQYLERCHDLLRDMWNERELEGSPKAKNRVRKFLEAKDGETV